jgi:hypothetical protein
MTSELLKEDRDRPSQEKSVAIVEEFIRQSSIRTVADLMQLDVKDRQWWPELTEGVVEPKKVDMPCLPSYVRPDVGDHRASLALVFLLTILRIPFRWC